MSGGIIEEWPGDAEASPNERVVMWRCVGMTQGHWCNYLMTDTEMQAHRFDLGCPRCKTPFADFVLDT